MKFLNTFFPIITRLYLNFFLLCDFLPFFHVIFKPLEVVDKFRARVVGPMEADGFGCEEDSNVVAVGSVRDVQVAEEVVRRSYLRMAREVERSESRNFRSRS